MPAFIQTLTPVSLQACSLTLSRCHFALEHYHDELFVAYNIAFPAKLQHAMPVRKAEYLAGRYLAQQLLISGGYGNVTLESDVCGAPLWPKGLSGSISHTHETALCAISSSRYTGIDVENIIPEKEAQALAGAIIGEEEQDYLAQQFPPFNRMLTLVFSAKESVYKALSRRHVIRDFHDIQLVGLDHAKGAFYCRIETINYCGRYVFEGDTVITLLNL